MTAILAGLMIGIGDIALLSADNRYMGALLFSVALLSIIHLKLPLYTGRIGRVILHGNYVECMKILFFNIVGVGLVTGYVAYLGGDLVSRLDTASASKFSKGYLSMFIAGVLCNVLIHIAVTAKNAYITVLCVMVFILSGYEHSIADFMFALADGNLLKWLVVIAGNTVGGIWTELCLIGGGTT